MKTRVLIVEDELSIQKILQFEMEAAGFAVEVASDGEEGLEKALASVYDVLILDVMMPKKDGFTVCRQLREAGSSVHIILLSARDAEFDRVLGLDTGADDYMVKPFSAKEVVSKVKAVMRRKETSAQAVVPTVVENKQVLTFKNLTIDLDKFEVKIEGKLVEFTLKEFELLSYMVKNKGRVLSRNILLDTLWGMNFYGETRVVDVHVFKVRDKLKNYDITIKTVRGVGYVLEEDA